MGRVGRFGGDVAAEAVGGKGGRKIANPRIEPAGEGAGRYRSQGSRAVNLTNGRRLRPKARMA